MDRALKREIMETMRMAILQAEEDVNERYLNTDELCKQFGMLTKDWVARNGKYLPRERVTILNPDGSTVSTRWGYPQKRISRMIKEGKLRWIDLTPNRTGEDEL